jgi:hypothetical protein
MEELCVRDKVEAIELLFVKIEYGAFRGAALQLWPRGEGCFTVEWPNNMDQMVILMGCRVDLHWLGGARVVKVDRLEGWCLEEG